MTVNCCRSTKFSDEIPAFTEDSKKRFDASQSALTIGRIYNKSAGIGPLLCY
jgi:hypothetical protein